MGIEQLIEAARKEDWDTVDQEIPKIVKKRAAVQWAYKTGIKDSNANVRDLAVSILEKAPILEQDFSGMRETVYNLMKSDAHRYVRFRAAFTLAVHGAGEHKKDVARTLQEAEKDKDVSDIAKNYMKNL